MTHKVIGVLILIMVFIFQAQSGKSTNPVDTTVTPEKKYRIGFTATALINKLPGLQLTQTYRLNRWFSADLETIFSFGDYFLDRRFVQSLGYRIRPGLRFYFTPNRENHNFSLKILIHYRNVKMDFEDNDVIRANGAYVEDIKGSVYSELIGYGATFDYSVNNYNHIVHFGLGFVAGNQFTRYSSEEIPNNGFVFMQSIMNPGRKRAHLPILYIHYLF